MKKEVEVLQNLKCRIEMLWQSYLQTPVEEQKRSIRKEYEETYRIYRTQKHLVENN